jgi:Mg-chelatase subunit ChlD
MSSRLRFCGILVLWIGCGSSEGTAAPAPLPRKPAIEVVFCLDTTGSMTGLLEGAKSKIWAICNQLLIGRPMPYLRVGLIAFRDRGDDYVTRVYDLRDDLDEVYADIRTFAANQGGDTPESVNQALDDAVNKMSWSKDRETIRIVFLVGDAPPHMDYPDDVKYPVTCQRAQEKGILINAIQCGNDAECTRYWKDIAALSGGSYAAIPQNGGVREISTPFDAQLSKVYADLLRSTLLFGDSRKRETDRKKLEAVQALPVITAADRAGYLAKLGKIASYDLLDAIRAGKVRLEDLAVEELPEVLHKLTAKERAVYLTRVAEQRGKLLQTVAELDRERSAYLNKELQRNRDSFDARVLEMLRRQIARQVRY